MFSNSENTIPTKWQFPGSLVYQNDAWVVCFGDNAQTKVCEFTFFNKNTGAIHSDSVAICDGTPMLFGDFLIIYGYGHAVYSLFDQEIVSWSDSEYPVFDAWLGPNFFMYRFDENYVIVSTKSWNWTITKTPPRKRLIYVRDWMKPFVVRDSNGYMESDGKEIALHGSTIYGTMRLFVRTIRPMAHLVELTEEPQLRGAYVIVDRKRYYTWQFHSHFEMIETSLVKTDFTAPFYIYTDHYVPLHLGQNPDPTEGELLHDVFETKDWNYVKSRKLDFFLGKYSKVDENERWIFGVTSGVTNVAGGVTIFDKKRSLLMTSKYNWRFTEANEISLFGDIVFVEGKRFQFTISLTNSRPGPFFYLESGIGDATLERGCLQSSSDDATIYTSLRSFDTHVSYSGRKRRLAKGKMRTFSGHEYTRKARKLMSIIVTRETLSSVLTFLKEKQVASYFSGDECDFSRKLTDDECGIHIVMPENIASCSLDYDLMCSEDDDFGSSRLEYFFLDAVLDGLISPEIIRENEIALALVEDADYILSECEGNTRGTPKHEEYLEMTLKFEEFKKTI